MSYEDFHLVDVVVRAQVMGRKYPGTGIRKIYSQLPYLCISGRPY